MPRIATTVWIPCLFLSRGAPAISPQTGDSLDPPRILVLREQARATHPKAEEEAINRLHSFLTRRGLPLVDRQQSEDLSRRSAEIVGGLAGAGTPDQKLCRHVLADVLIRISVQAEKEQMLQGRHVVKDHLHVRMVMADDPVILLDEAIRAEGRSFDGYQEAHLAAVDSMCSADGDGSLLKLVAGKLDALAREESAKGALYTVGIYTDSADQALIGAVMKDLDAAEGVVSGSVQQVSSGPIQLGNGRRGLHSEVSLRFKGRNRRLAEALYQGVDRLSSEGQTKSGEVLSPAVITSRRRIDLVLNVRKPETSLADELRRSIEDVTGRLYQQNQGYLDNKKLAVVPTAIASSQAARSDLEQFTKAYWGEYDRIAKLAAAKDASLDPLDFGGVSIQGRAYDSLRKARERGAALAEAYYGSKTGSLAMMIGKNIGQALENGSNKKVRILPEEREQSAALDLIKRETEIYREDGAVDPQSIAFLQRQGAQAVILSALKPYLQTYQLNIAIVDLNSGAAIREFLLLDKGLRKDLDVELGGG